MSDLIRTEFERTSVRDTRRQPPKGNNYIDPMAQMDWLAFQKGWEQSRAALVIELPSDTCIRLHSYSPYEVRDLCAKAVESAGVRVQP